MASDNVNTDENTITMSFERGGEEKTVNVTRQEDGTLVASHDGEPFELTDAERELVEQAFTSDEIDDPDAYEEDEDEEEDEEEEGKGG